MPGSDCTDLTTVEVARYTYTRFEHEAKTTKRLLHATRDIPKRCLSQRDESYQGRCRAEVSLSEWKLLFSPPLVFVLCQFQQFIVLIPVPVAGRSLRASTETPTYRHYDETCDLATTLRPLAFFLSGLSLCRGSR